MYDPPLNIIGKIAPGEPRNEQVTRRPAGARPLQSTRCSRAEQRGRRGRRCLFGSFVREPASARRASILPFDARGNGAPAGYLIILLPRRLRKPSRLEALFPIAPPSGTLADCVESGTERIPWAVSDTVCKNFATLNLYEFAAWPRREKLSPPQSRLCGPSQRQTLGK